MSDTIRVTGIGDGYDVTVEAGSLASLGDRVRDVAPAVKAIVVTNDAVGPLYLDAVRASLEDAGYEVVASTLPDGERHKTFASLAAVFDDVLPHRPERATPVIGLGGGVTTDMAGFVAATLLRGVPFVPVPTSLLAMVDASVGGKTGVNHVAGKNLIGAFHPPAAVVIDPAALATLPPRELRGGLAECVKHDVIRDAGHLATMENEADRYLAGDAEALGRLVAHNVRIKAAVVAADPYERGERAHLNLGHTFGHAFEKATHYNLSHGEAVAVGTVCACRAAVEIGQMSGDEASRVERLLIACGLPTGGVAADLDAVLAAMLSDKKVRDGRVRFVLPVGLGAATVRDDVEPALVREVLQSITA